MCSLSAESMHGCIQGGVVGTFIFFVHKFCAVLFFGLCDGGNSTLEVSGVELASVMQHAEPMHGCAHGKVEEQ